MEPKQTRELGELIVAEDSSAYSSIDLQLLRLYEMYEEFKNDVRLR